jgi:CBS domain-containing protein
MNIAFFLTPKCDVVWVPDRSSLGAALARMHPHSFSAVPILNDHGEYVGTLTEGDALWYLYAARGDWQAMAASTPVLAIARRSTTQPVHIDAEIETLMARAIDQNFVPVTDDRNIFIGIVRRRSIIEHCASKLVDAAASGAFRIS